MRGPAEGQRRQGVLALAGGCLLAVLAAGSGALGQAERALQDGILATMPRPAPTGVAVVEGLPLQATAAEHARLLERLAQAGVAQVVYLPALPAPQPPAQPSTPPPGAADAPGDSAPRAAGATPAVSPDDALERALRSPLRVWLAAQPLADGTAPTPPNTLQRASTVALPGFAVPEQPAIGWPADRWLRAAAGAGVWQPQPDADAVLRHVPTVLGHAQAGLPSLALAAALGAHHLGGRDLRWDNHAPVLGLGSLRIPLDAQGRAQPLWPADAPAVNATAVLEGTAPLPAWADRTVVVAPTTPERLALPGERRVTPGQALALSIEALRRAAVVSTPGAAPLAAGLAAGAAALLLWGLAGRLRLWQGWLLATGITVATAVLAWWGLVAHAWALPGLALAPLLWVGGMLAMSATALRARRSAPSEEARLLGLALQGQGNWAGAFAQFRQAPVTPELITNLLHLGKDLERQRQPTQARAVYEYLLRHDRQHREARSRLKRLRAAGTTPVAASPALPEGAAPAPLPERIGPYRVVSLLGQGAMGAVYLGRDEPIGRAVAIKTLALSREFDGDMLAQARERFLREAQAAGRLQHPGIVTIYGADSSADGAYIAMEYLQGADLGTRVADAARLPARQVLALGADVALALDYAHQHHVVHRDIKPANLHWNPATETVKVVDFGIARLADGLRTRTGRVLGTPSFMSPEQVQGLRVDGRSDLYSLGVTLFQLLTGTLPFRAASLPELLQAIVQQPAPDLRVFRPDLPPAVAVVLARALAKDPADRYPTGRALATALQEAKGALDETGGAPPAAPVVYHPRRAPGGDDMADFQETVMEPPAADSDPLSPSPTGAP